MEELKKLLSRVEEDIAYHEGHDLTYTRYYYGLLKKQKVILRTIRKLERIEEKHPLI